MPHHITRQPLVVEDEVIVSDIEDAMDIDPSSFDPGTPSTSSEAVCNGAGTGDDSTREEEEVKDKEEPVLPEGKPKCNYPWSIDQGFPTLKQLVMAEQIIISLY